MASYIQLLNFTEQGVKAYAGTLDRAKAAREAIEKMGGKMPHIYYTLGAYDAVVISEFPDDETATAFALKVGALGNVRTTTLRAFDEQEMAGILAKAK